MRDGLLLQMDIGGTVQLPAPESHPPAIFSPEFVLAAHSARHKAACYYPVACAEQWNTEFPAEHRAEIRHYAQARLLQLREMLELPPSGSLFP